MMLLGSVLLLVWGASLIHTSWDIIAHSTRYRGVITQNVLHKSRKPTFQSVGVFTDVQGVKRDFKSRIFSNPPAFSVGEDVTVLFNPDAPHNMRIESFVELWLPATVCVILGGVLLAAALWFPIQRWKRLRKISELLVNARAIVGRYRDTQIQYRSGRLRDYRIVKISVSGDKNDQDRMFISDGFFLHEKFELVPDQNIPVYVDPSASKKYWVDLKSLALRQHA